MNGIFQHLWPECDPGPFFASWVATSSVPTRQLVCLILNTPPCCCAAKGKSGVAELTQWKAILRTVAGYHAFKRYAQGTILGRGCGAFPAA